MRWPLPALAWLVLCLGGACEDKIDLGRDCAEPDCACTEPECVCRSSRQDLEHLPVGCDPGAQSCEGNPMGDEAACLGCYETNQQSGLGRNRLLDCACSKCAVQLAACRDSSDDVGNQYCGAVVNCALRRGCMGLSCYCGDMPADECRQAEAGTGPCAALVAAWAAAHAECDPDETEPACVLRLHETPADNVFHRAFALSNCVGNPTYGERGNCPPEVWIDAGVR